MSDQTDQDYAYQLHKDGSPRRCQSCGYRAPLKLFGPSEYASIDRASWLCRACAFSAIGLPMLYGGRSNRTEAAIAWTANAILDAIKTEAEEIKRLIRSERHGD